MAGERANPPTRLRNAAVEVALLDRQMGSAEAEPRVAAAFLNIDQNGDESKS
jgi:hypothetical protein